METTPIAAGPLEAPVRHWYGEDELREWLEGQGFRIAKAMLGSRENECNWYAYRGSELPARTTQCRLQEQH